MTGQAILDCLEDRLVAAIPSRVKEMEITEPAYCLRIWYFGTDVLPGERTPSLMLPKEAWRRRMLTERGENAPYSIWCADEIYNFRDAAYFAELADSTINEMVAEWYSQMPDRELPDDNDLIPFQGMVRRVAARLSQLDWSKNAAVSSDFVVMAADGSHSFGGDYEEMVASVPAERIDQFLSRRLLGGVDSWWTLEEQS